IDKQRTPSGGRRYIFYVYAQQKDHITSKTTITYQGVKYNSDINFNSGLCTCASSNIYGYGRYDWTKGSAARLRDIPKLPDELFDMIGSKPTTPPTTTGAIAPAIEAAPTTPAT
ncbi:MAG: hypothetical protein ACKPKO_17530, partial [Candidatus Fonsibacter sp.]